MDAAKAVKYFAKVWSGENGQLSESELEGTEEMFTVDDLNNLLMTIKNGKVTG